MSVELIGFGKSPYAIIMWTPPGESEATCKTVCMDEDDLHWNLKNKGYRENWKHTVHLGGN